MVGPHADSRRAGRPRGGRGRVGVHARAHARESGRWWCWWRPPAPPAVVRVAGWGALEAGLLCICNEKGLVCKRRLLCICVMKKV